MKKYNQFKHITSRLFIFVISIIMLTVSVLADAYDPYFVNGDNGNLSVSKDVVVVDGSYYVTIDELYNATANHFAQQMAY